MDIVVNILTWLHFIALAGGGAAAIGMAVVASRMSAATPETRPLLLGIMLRFSTIGHASIGTLIVTGPLIVFVKYGGFGGLSPWFWVKMALVLALLLGVIYGGITLKRSASSPVPVRPALPIGPINMALFLGIIFSAVFAFP